MAAVNYFICVQLTEDLEEQLHPKMPIFLLHDGIVTLSLSPNNL